MLSFVLLLVALSSVIVLLAQRHLSPNRDLFFLWTYAGAILYLHVAPIFSEPYITTHLFANYTFVQAMCLLLFELPLLWFYLYLRPAATSSSATIIPTREGKILFPLFVLLFTIAFVLVTLKHDAFYLWYGNKENLRRLNNMPLLDFALYRSFVLGGNLIAPLVLVLFAVTAKGDRFYVGAACIIGVGIFFVRQMSNSRSLSVATLCVVLGTLHTLASGGVLPHKWRIQGRHALAAAVVACYAVIVATNLRVFYGPTGTFSWDMLSPVQRTDSDVNPNMNPWLRLNGIDLITRIRLGSVDEPLAYGDAWGVPAYVIAAQLLDRDGVTQYKKSFEASAKRYLMARYTDLKGVDYPSCLLTDVYGNFGFIGFPFAALLIAWMLARISMWLYQPTSGRQIVIAIVFVILLLQFESEFINIALGWLRLAPLLALVFALSPVKVMRRVPAVEAHGEFAVRPTRTASAPIRRETAYRPSSSGACRTPMELLRRRPHDIGDSSHASSHTPGKPRSPTAG